MRSRHQLGLAPLVCLLTAFGCSDSGPTEVEGLPTIDGAPELEIEGLDFRFEPPTLQLTAGEPVNVVFEVTDGGHNLVVMETDFALPILDEGEITRGGLQIDEPGTYQLVCSVPGHLSEGMVGTVEVAAGA